MDVCDQVGGSITVIATRQPAQLAAFGLYAITINGPATPTPVAAPAITASRLTLPVRGKNNVYRFDVGPIAYSVPGMTAAQPQIQAVLPPLTVQGCLATSAQPCGNNDTSTWTTLGSYMPLDRLNDAGSTLTVGSPSGSPGATGAGSFFWQNSTTGTQYTHIRVLAGTHQSAPVSLAALPAPAASTTHPTSIALSAKDNSTTAVVEPNGVDQAQILVTIAASTTLPSSDPAYASVYYTDEHGAVVTNLYRNQASCSPNCWSNFVGVQPSAGGFSSTRRGAAGANDYDYVSSTGTQTRTLTAQVGTAPGAATDTIDVDGGALAVSASGATAAAGFSSRVARTSPTASPAAPRRLGFQACVACVA